MLELLSQRTQISVESLDRVALVLDFLTQGLNWATPAKGTSSPARGWMKTGHYDWFCVPAA